MTDTSPFRGLQGETHCVNHSCGYYEEREPTMGYKRKVAELKSMFGGEE